MAAEDSARIVKRSLPRRVLRLAGLLAVWVLVVAGVFAAAELGLRLAGKGHSMQPFLEVEYGGESYHVLNYRFYNQYFRDYRLSDMAVPSNTVVRGHKPENTFRAFVFGGSAANGWLFQEHSLTTLLQLQLSGLYPGKRIEVYNVAYAALNSHVMRRAAEACAKLDPDLFVIYMGNNEFVGPYSPQSVIGSKNYSKDTMRFIIRCQDLLSESRLYQLIRDPVQATVNKSVEGMKWGLDAPLTDLNDPRLSRTYALYEDNIRRMCAVGEEAGAAIALCTVAYNLRDWPPVLWQHRADITEAEKASWQAAFDEGAALQAQGQCEAAVAAYDRALAIDAHPANLQYQRARCLLTLGRNAEALEGFYCAADTAYERTAATRRSNGIVRRIAEEDTGDDAYVVETEQALLDASPGGVHGAGQFFDHMHLTYEATYVIATAVAKWVAAQRLVASETEGSLYGLDESRLPMAFTDGEELRHLEAAERWTSASHESYCQSWLAGRKAELQAKIAGGSALALPPDPAAIGPREDFWLLRDAVASQLSNEGRHAEALEQLKLLAARYPAVWNFWNRLVMMEMYTGQRAEAITQARAGVATYGGFAATWALLGLALSNSVETLPEAVAVYEKAVELAPENQAIRESCARTLAAAGHAAESIALLDKAPSPISFDENQRRRLVQEGLQQAAGMGAWDAVASGLEALLALGAGFDEVRQLLDKCGQADVRAGMLEICRRHGLAVPEGYGAAQSPGTAGN